MIDLNLLAKWIAEEEDKGHRIKASKLYRVFHRYVTIFYPDVPEWMIRHYRDRYW